MIFKTQPADFTSKLEVVACYLEHNGKFLLLQRNPRKPYGGAWGLPAGKVDEGEHTETAVRREVSEETGVTLGEFPIIYLGPLWVRTDDTEFVYHSFRVVIPHEPQVMLSPAEHQGYRWVTGAEAAEMELIHDLAACNELFCEL
jgi:8-oxo-dGTP diphosphatase